MKERDLQASIRQLATLLGWDVSCWWDSRKSPEGFPDLFLMKDDRIIGAELKIPPNKLSEAQIGKLTVMYNTGKIETYVWTPEHWQGQDVERILDDQIYSLRWKKYERSAFKGG